MTMKSCNQSPHYGKARSNEQVKERALQLLEELNPEQNSIISKWNELGWTPDTAYKSQALLQLKKHYCDQKRCLDCRIGNAVVKREEG